MRFTGSSQTMVRQTRSGTTWLSWAVDSCSAGAAARCVTLTSPDYEVAGAVPAGPRSAPATPGPGG
ncbi:hypothetical protein GCM10022262_32580 [Georgenia daeguensis]|uniref:DUF397 domain-containing protein n=1 Tax=Georgenia daeguensis TaxID=908355 RepID=A0ABP8EYQ7_9MICO